jgi:hypothetical protein
MLLGKYRPSKTVLLRSFLFLSVFPGVKLMALYHGVSEGKAVIKMLLVIWDTLEGRYLVLVCFGMLKYTRMWRTRYRHYMRRRLSIEGQKLNYTIYSKKEISWAQGVVWFNITLSWFCFASWILIPLGLWNLHPNIVLWSGPEICHDLDLSWWS